MQLRDKGFRRPLKSEFKQEGIKKHQPGRVGLKPPVGELFLLPAQVCPHPVCPVGTLEITSSSLCTSPREGPRPVKPALPSGLCSQLPVLFFFLKHHIVVKYLQHKTYHLSHSQPSSGALSTFTLCSSASLISRPVHLPTLTLCPH